MKIIQLLLHPISVCILLLAAHESLAAGGATARARGEDKEADAAADLALGMAGLKQAASDPTLLAQLLQDLQDPEMMAEAEKMRNSPEFKKQMKKMESDPKFKESLKQSKDMMKDPNTAAQMMAKAEHMAKVGADNLQKQARNEMAEAMNAMADADVMKQAQEMMKNPEFNNYMTEMLKKPEFKNYINAMQEMMEDPATKQRFEAMSESFKAGL